MNPSDYYTKMDITNNKNKGMELLKSINDEIEPVAKGTLMALPSEIVMTQEQYDDLMRLSNESPLFYQEDKLLKTKYNVMEVRVQNRKRLTFKEAHSLDDKAFEEWEKSVEGET